MDALHPMISHRKNDTPNKLESPFKTKESSTQMFDSRNSYNSEHNPFYKFMRKAKFSQDCLHDRAVQSTLSYAF